MWSCFSTLTYDSYIVLKWLLPPNFWQLDSLKPLITFHLLFSRFLDVYSWQEINHFDKKFPCIEWSGLRWEVHTYGPTFFIHLLGYSQSRLKESKVYPPMSVRFLLLILLGTPCHDLILCSNTWVRIYKLYLCLPTDNFINIYTYVCTQSYVYI